jgi:F-type H+-transporting ATPase subunit delta
MAELATIARPYAEALFKAIAGSDAQALKAQHGMRWRQLAANAQLRQFADNPKVAAVQVFDLIAGVALSQGLQLDAKIGNLLRAVLDNGRLAALPEIAAQFGTLVNASSGVSDALIQSAFPIDGDALADVVATLEKRFAASSTPRSKHVPELIGGIRVAVGDEVLDTSVRPVLNR